MYERYNGRCCDTHPGIILEVSIEYYVDDHTRHNHCFGFTAPVTNKNHTGPSLQFIPVLLDPAA